MAVRPLLFGLVSVARGGGLNLTGRTTTRRAFHPSATRGRPTVATSSPSQSTPLSSQVPQPPQTKVFADSQYAAFLGEADSNDGHDAYRDSHGPLLPALEAENSAFLGEADSNDAFEVRRHLEGDKHESVDSQYAAFLGEADSDDGFEARRAAEGDTHESMDASNAAFLGEADSDDAHEADFDINPERHRHIIEDATPSGFHGQHGEHDQ